MEIHIFHALVCYFIFWSSVLVALSVDDVQFIAATVVDNASQRAQVEDKCDNQRGMTPIYSDNSCPAEVDTLTC